MNRARVRGAIAARRHSSLLGALTAWDKHMEKRVGGMRGRRSKYIERGAKFSAALRRPSPACEAARRRGTAPPTAIAAVCEQTTRVNQRLSCVASKTIVAGRRLMHCWTTWLMSLREKVVRG